MKGICLGHFPDPVTEAYEPQNPDRLALPPQRHHRQRDLSNAGTLPHTLLVCLGRIRGPHEVRLREVPCRGECGVLPKGYLTKRIGIRDVLSPRPLGHENAHLTGAVVAAQEARVHIEELVEQAQNRFEGRAHRFRRDRHQLHCDASDQRVES